MINFTHNAVYFSRPKGTAIFRIIFNSLYFSWYFRKSQREHYVAFKKLNRPKEMLKAYKQPKFFFYEHRPPEDPRWFLGLGFIIIQRVD